MSAIYGIIGAGDLSHLQLMGERLCHRGLVVSEWSPFPGVFFGCRHPKGKSSQRKAVSSWTIADAALYNRKEIADLLNISKQLYNLSDQEVIQKAFDHFGIDCFTKFNGDFVTAIWDHLNTQLVIARDPMGVKSVYYFVGKDFFAFASEYKALLALERITATPNLESLQYLSSSKYLPTGKTLLERVFSMPAGHWMKFSQNNLVLQRYWQVNVNPKQITESFAEEELRNILFKAMDRRIENIDVLGVELSGGIDSSAIVVGMRKLRPDKQIKTFTIGSGPDDPEILLSRKVAAIFDTEHHEVIADPSDLLDELESLVWHLEDPIGRTEPYLYFQLVKIAHLHLDILFGGYAGDGLFAGMPKHKIIKIMQMLPVIRNSLEEFYHYTQLSNPPRTYLGRAAKRLYYGRKEMPAPKIVGAISPPYPRPLPKNRDGLLNHVLRSGLEEGVPGWMPKVEKPHSSHGMEIRSPFTDPDLIEFSFLLPESFKIRGFKDKYILRKALVPLIPKEIAQRPKFPQSMDYDLRLSEVLDALADKYLNSKLVKQRGFFKVSEIESLRQRNHRKAYSSNRAMRLWTAITSEIWAQTFLDNRGAHS